MYAITGITGRVGGAVARTLLAGGHRVRAVLRDESKAAPWAALGCEIANADITDARALTRAFARIEGVFLMTPPNFDPEPGFPDTVAAQDAVVAAVEATRPGRLVFLSTVGAHVAEPNLLTNATLTEARLKRLPIPVALLRAAWFMENFTWDLPAARTGTVPSFLQPLDHPIPMVATTDIGRTAADLLLQSWTGTRIVELEAARRYSANDVAAGFAAALGQDVSMAPVPRDSWEELFRSQGAKHPLPRIRMLDGFNEGWIDFEGDGTEHRTAATTLDAVLRAIVEGDGQ